MQSTKFKLPRARRGEVIESARYAAAHHPWRNSIYDILNLGEDFLKTSSTQFAPNDLNARGRAVANLFYEEFTKACKAGVSGGGSCDRCGKTVEEGRYNVCLKCARKEETAERESQAL